jgi:ketosteroid isomerase-like protein
VSLANVERIRESVEAVNRGDLDAALDRVHPDAEWQTLDLFPDAATYRGPEEIRQFFRTWQNLFRGFRLHLEKCVPVGEDHVLAALRVSGEGSESGASVASPVFFQLFEIRDGYLVRTQMFRTERDAVHAAERREA